MAGKKELISISQAFANIADALETRSGDNVVYYPEYQNNPNGFLKDVLGIDQWEIPSQIIDSVWANGRTTVRSCHASSKCVDENEWVYLANGRERAKDLVNKSFDLYTIDQGYPKKTVAGAVPNGIQRCFKLETESGFSCTRTFNHPLYMKESRRLSRGEWKEIEKTEVGEYVAVVDEYPSDCTSLVSDDLVKVLAYMITEGYTKAGMCQFTQNEGKVLDDFIGSCARLGYKYNRGSKTIARDTSQVTFGNLMAKYNLRQLSDRKFIPDIIFSLPKRQQALFLSCMYSCDGWISTGKKYDTKKSGEGVTVIGYVSKSETLVRDLKTLLLRFGIFSRIGCWSHSWTHKGEKKSGNYWHLNIWRKRDTLRFNQEISVLGKEYRQQTQSRRAGCKAQKGRGDSYWSMWGLPSCLRWEKVTKIEDVGNRKTVAITVPETGTFLSEFYEHNSFSAAAIALTFLHTYRPSTVITTAPGGRQAKEVIWAEIHDIYHKAKKPLGGRLLQTKLSMSETEKWVGLGFAVDEDRPETLQGYHNQNILIIVDEACFRSDTEILTNNGWKYFQDLTLGDLVATKDGPGGVMYYSQPTEYHVYPYRGYMKEVDIKGCNFSITPNHNLFAGFRTATTGEVNWALRKVGDIPNSKVSIMGRTLNWTGEKRQEYTIKGYAGVRKTWDDITVPMKPWCRFLGWYLSEGCCDSSGYAVSITQKYRDKIDDIEKCITDLGLPYKEYSRKVPGGSTEIRIQSRPLVEELSQLGKCLNKRVPQYLRELSPELIEEFLDAFRMGDGYKKNNVDVYYTSSKELATDLHELCLKTGYTSFMHKRRLLGKSTWIKDHTVRASVDGFVVTRSKERSNIWLHMNSVKDVHYEGNVYCVSVEPHHLIFTRRNGYCMWSGNSGVARPIFEAIEGLLSSGRLVRLLLIGNPNDEATLFGDSFREGSIYTTFHISAFDTPNFTAYGVTEEDFKNTTWKDKITGPLPRPYLTSPEWAYNMYKTYGPDSPLYMVRVRGDFPPISEDTLIPLPWIEKATDAKLIGGVEDKTWLGVDVARFGTDESVLTVRKGDTTLLQKAYNSLDGFFLADKVEEIMSEFGIDASQVNVDEIGIGGSPIDFLRHREKYVKAINASSKASDTTMYVNTRAEMYYTLRNRFKSGTISIPKSDLLIDELSKIKYKFSNGKIQIEDKKEMKKRIGKSPDRADSIAMAYYEPKGAPLADLGSLQRPKSDPNTDPRTKIYDDDTYSDRINSLFKAEVPEDVDKCPKCDTHIGLEYRARGVRSNEKEGMEKLCLICRTKWSREGHTWVEKIVD